MKNALLFVILVLSITAFAQRKQSISNTIADVHGWIGLAGRTIPEIHPERHLGQVNKNQIPDQGSFIRIFDSIYKWKWDSLNIGWKIYSKTLHMIYDTQDNLTSDITQIWNGSSWINSEKNIDTYDASKNETSKLTQVWKDTTWVNAGQNIYTYDAGNNETSELDQDWSSGAWQNTFQYIYTYDAHNNRTSETDQYWIAISWVNNAKYI